METISKFNHDFEKRINNREVVYPIEAKYLDVMGCRSYYTELILDYAKHSDYRQKEANIKWINRQRLQKTYNRALSRLIYSIENNNIGIDAKPLIAIKPILAKGDYYEFDCQCGYSEVLQSKGIYFLYRNSELLYIGSSKNILSRIKSHYWRNEIPFNCFKFFLMKDRFTMNDVIEYEYYLINDLLPPYNKRFK